MSETSTTTEMAISQDSSAIVHRQQSDQTNAMLMMAMEKQVDIAVIKELVELKNQQDDRFAKSEYYRALSAFQSELPPIPRLGKAKFKHKQGDGVTEYDFARLEDISEIIKPYLMKYGLSYHYNESMEEKGIICVECVVSHALGHQESNSMRSIQDTSGSKNPIQAVGSTISYLRRYTLTGGLGIVTAISDDDGNSVDSESGSPSQNGGESGTYPQCDFEANVTKWVQTIINNNKSVTDMVEWLGGKGIVLAPNQVKELTKLVKEKQG